MTWAGPCLLKRPSKNSSRLLSYESPFCQRGSFSVCVKYVKYACILRNPPRHFSVLLYCLLFNWSQKAIFNLLSDYTDLLNCPDGSSVWCWHNRAWTLHVLDCRHDSAYEAFCRNLIFCVVHSRILCADRFLLWKSVRAASSLLLKITGGTWVEYASIA